MIRMPFLFILGFILLTACNPSNLKYNKLYFDFDSLLTVQEAAVVKNKLKLSKTVLLDGKQDRSTQFVDSASIAQELDVFRQLDLINKPLYRNTYLVSDGVDDSLSNLTLRQYTSTTQTPIPWVTFYYQRSFQQLMKVESLYRENNALYSTERNLLLEFDNSSGKLLLSRYRLTGFQKMILNDTVYFSVEGVLEN